MISRCAICDTIFPRKELHYVDDGIDDLLVCDSCSEVCAFCGERGIPEYERPRFKFPYFCTDCYKKRFSKCKNCGKNEDFIVYVHNDHAYCNSCALELGYVLIREKFQEDTKEYFGDDGWEDDFFKIEEDDFFKIELEIEYDGDGKDFKGHRFVAEQLHQNVKNKEIFYLKEDSFRGGLKIVSEYCTIDYHMNEINWKGVFETAKKLRYTSYDNGKCGLHIHLDRTGLKDKDIEKLLFITKRFWNEIVVFSRWGKKLPMDKNFIVEPDYEPIQFNIFRGTLDCKTFMASLQFVKRLKDLVVNHTEEELVAMMWEHIATYLESAGYKELNNYLKERGLTI